MEGKLSTHFPHYPSIIEGHRRKTNNHLPHCILGDIHNIIGSTLLLKKYTFNLCIGDHHYLHLCSRSFTIFADWFIVDFYCGGNQRLAVISYRPMTPLPLEQIPYPQTESTSPIEPVKNKAKLPNLRLPDTPLNCALPLLRNHLVIPSKSILCGQSFCSCYASAPLPVWPRT